MNNKEEIKKKIRPLMPASAYDYFVKWFDAQPERKYQQFTAFHKEDGSTDIYIDGILKYEIQPGTTWTIQEWFIADEIKPIIPARLESEVSDGST